MMTKLRLYPVPVPERMKGLPVDPRTRNLVPKFVQDVAEPGAPPNWDFRVMSVEHMRRCVAFSLCWLCGQPLGQNKAAVIGPMCCINRLSAEPASHLECARFAAQVCPFLTAPKAIRREANKPDHVAPPGIMLEHNPGVAAIWVAREIRTEKHRTGLLFRLGEPNHVEFWAKGRPATREEVDAAVAKGFPILERGAAQDGRAGIAELKRWRARFDGLLDHFLPPQRGDAEVL